MEKEKRVFYWYRTTLGRWAPCLDTRFPSKGPDKPMPKLAFPAIELKGDDYNLSLTECMKKWPVDPPEEPEMVPAEPPKPIPPSSEGESIFSMPFTEIEPKKAKT